MQLTRASDYILRIVYYLATQPLGALVRRPEILEATDVPDSIFPKLASQLQRAGLIKITQGARGGYRLLVPPAELTLLAAIEAGVGELALNDCVLRPGSCHRSPHCVIHVALDEVSHQMREGLRHVTFADLIAGDASREDCLETCPASSARPCDH